MPNMIPTKPGYGKYRSQNPRSCGEDTRTLSQKIADFDHSLANMKSQLAETTFPHMKAILERCIAANEARRAEAVAMARKTGAK